MYRWHNALEQKLVSPVELSQDFFDVEESTEQDFLLYDKALEERYPDFISNFLNKWGVASGESLKSLRSFPENVESIVQRWPQLNRQSILYVLGGGSLGDFGGFVASILKRGIHLIHIPTTWLAALDSAHGGKNALNIPGAKNQLGTFYPAQEIWLIKRVLDDVPEKIRQQSLGEFVKMALLTPETPASFYESYDGSLQWYWAALGPLINKKLEIVGKDPYELSGDRALLNLGHTMGHVLELQYGLHHGDAVFQGLHFTLSMSVALNLLTASSEQSLRKYFCETFGHTPLNLKQQFEPMDVETFLSRLTKDKKWEAGHLAFPLLTDSSAALENMGPFGHIAVNVQPVPIEAIVAEALREGWVTE